MGRGDFRHGREPGLGGPMAFRLTFVALRIGTNGLLPQTHGYPSPGRSPSGAGGRRDVKHATPRGSRHRDAGSGKRGKEKGKQEGKGSGALRHRGQHGRRGEAKGGDMCRPTPWNSKRRHPSQPRYEGRGTGGHPFLVLAYTKPTPRLKARKAERIVTPVSQTLSTKQGMRSVSPTFLNPRSSTLSGWPFFLER